jgi:hypothetical protein
MRIRYSMSSPPGRGTGAFLPRPVGGGHTTPASTTHGIVEVFAGKLMKVSAPSPFQGRQSNATPPEKHPEFIRPDRYVTTPHGMWPKVKYSVLQPAPLPVPARQTSAQIAVVARRPTMGGKVENTRWPKAWQSYTRKAR